MGHLPGHRAQAVAVRDAVHGHAAQVGQVDARPAQVLAEAADARLVRSAALAAAAAAAAAAAVPQRAGLRRSAAARAAGAPLGGLSRRRRPASGEGVRGHGAAGGQQGARVAAGSRGALLGRAAVGGAGAGRACCRGSSRARRALSARRHCQRVCAGEQGWAGIHLAARFHHHAWDGAHALTHQQAGTAAVPTISMYNLVMGYTAHTRAS